MEALPPTVKRLIEMLDADYPAATPRPNQDLAFIMYNAGQRSVIERLLALLAAEE